jgi:hypothetical protein
MWRSLLSKNWQGELKYSEKACPSVTLFTTIPTLPDLGSNLGRRGVKPATKRLHSTAVTQKFVTQTTYSYARI